MHSQVPLAKSLGILLCGLKDFSTEPAKYSLSILRSYLACIPVYLILKYCLNDNIVLSIYLFFGLFSHLWNLVSPRGNGGLNIANTKEESILDRSRESERQEFLFFF